MKNILSVIFYVHECICNKIYLSRDYDNINFPQKVTVKVSTPNNMKEIKEYLSEYCSDLGQDLETILNPPLTVITLDSKKPYNKYML